MRKIPLVYLTLSSFCLSSTALASDFSIPFVNTSSLGVGYADWATAASDASTTYTNPAGLPHLKSQQLMVNPMGMIGSARFSGTAQTPPYPFPAPVIQSGNATSPISAFLPSFFYAKPLTDKVTFGVGATAPFGLGTNYGHRSLVRYAATRSQVLGLDIAASLGTRLTDRISLGAGFDALRLAFTLNNMYGPPLSFPDSGLKNHQTGWGYGWHAGILFDVLPTTRLGASFNSEITLDSSGTSSVYLPSGNALSTAQHTRGNLPARAQISLQHDLTPRWAGMFSVFYTHWQVFEAITMDNTMTPMGFPLRVAIPFNYENCFDYAAGSSFKISDKLKLRGGLHFLGTPSNDIDRGVADPIGSATIATVGAHYQHSDTLSYDAGIAHSFFKRMPVRLVNELTSLNGYNSTQTTVAGLQINWSIS